MSSKTTTTTITMAMLVAIILGAPATSPAAAPGAEIAAPDALYPPPPSYFLLRLVGDYTDLRYTPGALDRAANVQTRLELTGRAFRKWAKTEPMIRVYVLSREKWEEVGYAVPYGLPVRIGTDALAVPATGDAGTVELWSRLLDGLLPAVHGTPLLGTPNEVATMLLADVYLQLLASELLLDSIAFAAEDAWVRGLAAHAVTLSMMTRLEPDRLPSVELMYQRLAELHPPESMSAADYRQGIGLGDWLWFQAQLHQGGKALVEQGKKGKDLIQGLRKLQKRGGGVVRDEDLLRQYKLLRPWLDDHFSAVSLRVD